MPLRRRPRLTQISRDDFAVPQVVIYSCEPQASKVRGAVITHRFLELVAKERDGRSYGIVVRESGGVRLAGRNTAVEDQDEMKLGLAQ